MTATRLLQRCLPLFQGDPLERAYQRADIIEKWRQLMQAWGNYCERGEPAAEADNIVAAGRNTYGQRALQ